MYKTHPVRYIVDCCEVVLEVRLCRYGESDLVKMCCELRSFSEFCRSMFEVFRACGQED